MILTAKNLYLKDPLVHTKVIEATPGMIKNRATQSTKLTIKRSMKMQSLTESINSAERGQLREMHTNRESSNAKETIEVSKDIIAAETTPLRKEPVDTTESIGATITKMMTTLGLDM